MTKSLAPKPSVKFLKLEAKSILKAHRNADSSCCDILRNLHQFKDKPDKEIFDSQTSLQEVQFALAMEYNFKSWVELKEYVSSAKRKVTKIENLAMKPFSTTLMGTLNGVADYFDIPISEPMLYGLSGHAFLVNIHKQICPSSPYCWDKSRFNLLLENIGIKITDLGFYSRESSLEERNKLENILCKALDAGIPCSLCNMENQLIKAYDERGFFVVQPWERPCVDATPSKLSFGTWKEFKEEIHVSFYTFKKVTSVDRTVAILDSLDYAIDLHAKSSEFSWEAYGIGPEAYTNWISAAEEYGSTHGNWWNATVWSECRSMAAKYFAEIGKEYKQVLNPAADLEKLYTEVANNLKAVSNKEMPPADKISLLKETKKKEAEAIKRIKSFRALLHKVFTQ
ncbi:MAG: hypothetical protein KOO69_06610 [Victivallales bacterium]|nr:hypothetical protein [Victivallales bacterium]